MPLFTKITAITIVIILVLLACVALMTVERSPVSQPTKTITPAPSSVIENDAPDKDNPFTTEAANPFTSDEYTNPFAEEAYTNPFAE